MTNTQRGVAEEAIHNANGTEDDEGYVSKIGAETLKTEHEFNKDAGFNMGDDELPACFHLPSSRCSLMPADWLYQFLSPALV